MTTDKPTTEQRLVMRSSVRILPEMSLRSKILACGDDHAQIVWMLLLPLFVKRMVAFFSFVEARRSVKQIENRIRNHNGACVDPMFKQRYLKYAENLYQLDDGYLDKFEAAFYPVFNILFQEQFFAFFPQLLHFQEMNDVGVEEEEGDVVVERIHEY